jgi:hypothetical protein
MAATVRPTRTFGIVAWESVRFSMSAISGPSSSLSLFECYSRESVNVHRGATLFAA